MPAKRKILALSCAVLLVWSSATPAASGLEQAIVKNLDAMVNVTTPGIFETQRRGVVSGGGVYWREPISSVQLVSLSAPSFRAGCGGIDAYFGSLSYINKDQLVSLLRNIAANSAGYLFQLALGQVSPQIASWLSKFQQIVQEMNAMNVNSCQFSQGFVNNTLDAMTGKTTAASALWGTVQGIFSDSSEALRSNTKPVATNLSKATDEDKKNWFGNIVWNALFSPSTDLGQFLTAFGATGGSDKTDLAQMLMSASSTIVVGKPEAAGDSGDTVSTTQTFPAVLELDRLVEGDSASSLLHYQCDTVTDKADGCLNPTPAVKTDFKGLKSRMKENLLGPGMDASSGGVIFKWTQPNQGAAAFSAEEKALLQSMGPVIGPMLRNLSLQTGRGGAVYFVDQAAGSIAYDVTYRMMQQMIGAVEVAVSGSRLGDDHKIHALVNESRHRLDVQFQTAMQRNLPLNKLGKIYSLAMQLSETSMMQYQVQSPGKAGSL